jgi:hypothetical protein
LRAPGLRVAHQQAGQLQPFQYACIEHPRLPACSAASERARIFKQEMESVFPGATGGPQHFALTLDDFDSPVMETTVTG